MSEKGLQGYCRINNIDYNQFKKIFLIKDLNTESYMACSVSTPDEMVFRLRDALKKIKKTGLDKKILEKYPPQGPVN